MHSTITIGASNTNTNTNTLIHESRLKYLLELEKNYIHIIAQGVQTKIKSDKDEGKIIKETVVLRGP